MILNFQQYQKMVRLMNLLNIQNILEINIYFECQIFKYKHKNLSFLQTFEVYSYRYGIYNLKFDIFDDNKIGFFIYNPNQDGEYDIINILQYENQKISYYKNFRNITIPSLKFYSSYEDIYFANTEQGIGLFASYHNTHLYYLSPICLSKTIILKANELLDFPIEEFIIPAVELLKFSFEEINDNLIIYKNSLEIKIGEIFNDLNNFK